MVQSLNIFVAIAPSHIERFEIIAKKYTAASDKNILINAGNYQFDNSVWDQILSSDVKMGNPSGSRQADILFQLAKISAYKRLIRNAQSEIPPQNFTLYYCNLEDVLNNYFFFSFRNSMLKEPVLVEDGIMNYYSYEVESSRKTTFVIKKWLCKLFDIPYKIVRGQLSGIDMEIVQKQYVSFPTKAVYPEKAIGLPRKKISYTPEKGLVLFIGQDILENQIGSKNYLASVQEIIESMNAVIEENAIIYYKPHRNGNYQRAYDLIRETYGERSRLLIDNTPVESLIEEIRPSYIFSFYSTALLNIRMSLGLEHPAEIYSKPLDATDPKVIKLFKESGIQIIQ